MKDYARRVEATKILKTLLENMKEKENNVSTREHRAYERNLIYDVYIDIITILKSLQWNPSLRINLYIYHKSTFLCTIDY